MRSSSHPINGWIAGLGRVLLQGAIGYLLVLGILFAAQRHLIFPRYLVDAEMSALPVDGYVSVLVPTQDGEMLHAFWRSPAPGKPVVVSFHGNADHPWTHAHRFAASAWDGYGVLAIAFRGYPHSTGSPSEQGLLLDGEAAIDFVRDRVPGSTLILHGHSLGAAVAVAMSEHHASVALLIEAPFLSMMDMVTTRLPIVPGFLVQDAFRSDLRLPRSKACSILLIHGDVDLTIPLDRGRALAGTNSRVEMHVVQGADHGSVVGAADGWVVERLQDCISDALAPERSSPIV